MVQLSCSFHFLGEWFLLRNPSRFHHFILIKSKSLWFNFTYIKEVHLYRWSAAWNLNLRFKFWNGFTHVDSPDLLSVTIEVVCLQSTKSLTKINRVSQKCWEPLATLSWKWKSGSMSYCEYFKVQDISLILMSDPGSGDRVTRRVTWWDHWGSKSCQFSDLRWQMWIRKLKFVRTKTRSICSKVKWVIRFGRKVKIVFEK